MVRDGRTPVLKNEPVMYAVRIHRQEGVTEADIEDYLSSLGGSYFMVEETEANRAHFQGFVYSRLAEQTCRVRLKTKFPMVVGNNGYSFKKVLKPDEYQIYVCKGDAKNGQKGEPPKVVCSQGIEYTQDWIAHNHEEYWKHELAEAREYKKNKGRANDVIWEKVDELKEVTSQAVIDIIIDTYTNVGKSYDLYGVRRLRNVIMSKYCKKWRAHMKCIANLDEVTTALETHKYNQKDIEGLDYDGF